MAEYDISKITTSNGDTCNLKDKSKLPKNSTPVTFGGSEVSFAANLATLLNSMSVAESKIISTYVNAETDNFLYDATYYGFIYKIDNQYATGIITDNERSVVLIGRSSSGTIYFNALAKAAVVPVSVGGTSATTADGACTNIGAMKRTATYVAFNGSEANFSSNLVTLLGNMAVGESRFISTFVDAVTDNFAAYATYYGTLYKIDSQYATGSMTDNVRSTVLIGRSGSDIVYFSALTKAAVIPIGVGGTGAANAAGARTNIGNGCPTSSFTTAEGKIVTVTNGFITGIT